jgi:hypothetical protein
MNIVNESGTAPQVQAVRDNRGKGWFWADHEVIDTYGPRIGVYGVGVYMYLARRVDDTSQRCWPSYQTIADALNISRPKAIEAVQDLVACGLIAIEPRIVEGHQSSNYFILLPSAEWLPVADIQLPSHAKKSRGKQDLPHGKQDLLPSKRRGKQDLPKQETSKEKTINKKQQTSVVVDFVNSSLSNDETQAIIQSLIELRLTPDAAQLLASLHPERCRHYLPLWRARGFEGVRSTAAAVRDSIENPSSSWVQMLDEYKASSNGSAPNGSRRSTPKAPPPETLEAAAADAYDLMSVADKAFIEKCVELEGLTLQQAIERYRNAEFARALKALQKSGAPIS